MGKMTLMTNRRFFAMLLCLLVSGCRPAPDRSTTSAPHQWATYPARGVIQSVDPDARHAFIAHEDIPGYMAAMTMRFFAKDRAELTGLEQGDEITFQLNVGEKESFIDAVRKTGRKKAVSAADTTPSTPPQVTELPDTMLIDDAGNPFRLSDLQGNVLAITFIFTRCPLPDFCPRMSMHFADVQKELAASAPSAKWKLLSISIDPAYDTPERLREYAERYRASNARWIFATGDAGAIHSLASASGLSVSGEAPSLNHNLRTIILAPDGKVSRIFPGNEWTPAEVAAEIKRQLASQP
jgi:protein SCO1/2